MRRSRFLTLLAASSITVAVLIAGSAITRVPRALGLVTESWADPAASQGGVVAVPAEFKRDPLYYYFDDRPTEAIRLANLVLGDPAAPRPLREQVLVTVATIRLGQRRVGAAREAFLQLLAGNPTADLERPARLPPAVTRLFYHLRDSVCAEQQTTLVDTGKLSMSIRTLAVGDIENNSIVKAGYDTDHFCKGLVQVIISDLQGATPLKIVDRQRLSVLLDEIGLGKDPSRMDPENRVRMGHLCGAQSYLFGQFMQLDRQHVRLDLRWVDTSTGEILLAKGAEGSAGSADDLFKLEKRVLLELLAPEVQRLVDSTQAPGRLQRQIETYLDGKKRSLSRKPAYVTMVEASGRAVSEEDAGHYDRAIAEWQRVAAFNPADSTAQVRARSLAAYQKLQRG